MTVANPRPASTLPLPADLYGRRHGDRTLRLLDAMVNARMRWTALTNRRDVAPRADDRRIRVRVVERQVRASDNDVVSLRLAAVDGRALPVWRPGAHLDLELPSGRLRQYSLCGDPADTRTYRIAVRRIPDGDGGSNEVHRDISVGSALVVRGPRNAFPFAVPGHGSPATRLHFVAGGIGITPILPMMRSADSLGVEWTMLYTGRARDTLPFLNEVEGFGARVTVRTDDRYGLPAGAELVDGVRRGSAVYCCGPAPMIGAVAAAVRGIPGVELHSERFSAPPIVDGVPFEIELARSGEVLDVPADRSALDVLLAHRPDQPYSCRQGFCRTCKVRVLSGSADHRDSVLSPTERADGALLTCVSRCAGGRLVLDL
ncbi:putative oxidoreductase [Nocardia jinanensis]|uniref:Oxidoreductase n=2 Tax=Nocardia jinanensis TaxID=382504 RepID=A0A917RJ64_9NOCA|nr:PDR/VanB family oxidoreductase [Nocardia jinanensis]GGL09612.1 putative oxidoreductase [Nocardia jinanensis]